MPEVEHTLQYWDQLPYKGALTKQINTAKEMLLHVLVFPASSP